MKLKNVKGNGTGCQKELMQFRVKKYLRVDEFVAYYSLNLHGLI